MNSGNWHIPSRRTIKPPIGEKQATGEAARWLITALTLAAGVGGGFWLYGLGSDWLASKVAPLIPGLGG